MKVTIKGYEVLIDDEDIELVNKYSWNAISAPKDITKKIYFCYGIKKKTIYLHRLIAKTNEGFICDHKNGNTFDCTKENLRNISAQQSRLNSHRKANSKTKYKGVFCKRDKFYSKIQTKEHKIHLGTFDTQESAALAYEVKMFELYGTDFRLTYLPMLNVMLT